MLMHRLLRSNRKTPRRAGGRGRGGGRARWRRRRCPSARCLCRRRSSMCSPNKDQQHEQPQKGPAAGATTKGAAARAPREDQHIPRWKQAHRRKRSAWQSKRPQPQAATGSSTQGSLLTHAAATAHQGPPPRRPSRPLAAPHVGRSQRRAAPPAPRLQPPLPPAAGPHCQQLPLLSTGWPAWAVPTAQSVPPRLLPTPLRRLPVQPGCQATTADLQAREQQGCAGQHGLREPPAAESKPLPSSWELGPA